MSKTNNKLEIKNLSKRFGEKILFENLSLTVDGPAVLWAPSGWGKTTLLRILMGLEAPTSGSVEGVGRVGAVFQEDRLCPQLTAEENVALVLTAEQYKVKTQYKEEIRDDIIQLGLDDEALALPARKLSGGQKQRLAIARAIAKNPKIYVFDDSFSALDMKTDAALRRALETKTEHTTVIIVAQRISTILHADQILVLDDGKIVGKGTHEELLHNCEVYEQIARSQLSAKELGLSEEVK